MTVNTFRNVALTPLSCIGWLSERNKLIPNLYLWTSHRNGNFISGNYRWAI